MSKMVDIVSKEKFIKFVNNELIEILKLYEKKRFFLEQSFRGIKVLSLLSFISLWFGIFFLSLASFWISGLFFAVLIIFLFFVVLGSRLIFQCEKNIKNNILNKCCSQMGDFEIQNHLNSDYIAKSSLVSRNDFVLDLDSKTKERLPWFLKKLGDVLDLYRDGECISGRVGHTCFLLQELSCSSGEKAVLLRVCIDKKLSGETVVLEKSVKNHLVFKNKEFVEIEDLDFMSDYHVFSDNQVESRVVLSPVLVEKIKKMKNIFDSTRFEMSFCDNQLLIIFYTLNGIVDIFNIKQNALDTRCYDLFYDEIKSICEIVKILNIDNENLNIS